MIQNRIVGSGFESPAQLLAHPMNFRTHPKAQQEAVLGLMSDVGWVKHIVVNRRTGNVIDGHLRVSLALRDNIDSVPVTYVDLSEREELLVLAALDKTSELAGVDESLLDNLLRSVTTNDPALMALLESMAIDAEIIQAEDPDDDPSESTGTICPKCGHCF